MIQYIKTLLEMWVLCLFKQSEKEKKKIEGKYKII